MEISNEKISELLKNPEIVGMIASLASGFSSGSSASETDDKPLETEENAVVAQSSLSDETSSGIMQSLPQQTLDFSPHFSDRRIALLQAIKPYINDTKKDKVDSLVKAIGVAGILSNYTGGMFGNLFGKQ